VTWDQLLLRNSEFTTDLLVDNSDSGYIDPILSQHLFDPYPIAPHVSVQDYIHSSFSKCVSLIGAFSAGAFGQASRGDGFPRPDNVREIKELVDVSPVSVINPGEY
jgi:hypothetical protein